VQTLAGRGRIDASPATVAILAIGVACLVVPVGVTALAWLADRR